MQREAMMNGRFSSTIAFLSLLCCTNALAACPPKARNCVDLNGLSDIAGQIVASEKLEPLPHKPPPDQARQPYSGPTVGLSKTVRQTPTVGYRWAIQ
jgi:hypothetical protein